MHRYLEYLPPEIQEFREFRLLDEAVNPYMQEAHDYIVQKYLNQYLQTADIATVRRWEKIYNIAPAPGDSLAVRRLRVLAKFLAQLPFTYKALLEYLDNYGDITPVIDKVANHFQLEMDLVEELRLDELMDNLRQLIPANMTMGAQVLYGLDSTFFVGAAPVIGETVEIPFAQDEGAEAATALYIGAAAVVGEIVSITD